MSNTLQPPKRPKPVVPVMTAVVALLYAVVAGLYFAEGTWGFGALWAVLTLAWIGAVLFSIKSYRIQVDTWQTILRTHAQLRRLEEDRAGRWTI